MRKVYKKCFVTVGTTRFDLLCEYILTTSVLNTLKDLGCTKITMQIGNSDRDPVKMVREDVNISMYRFKDSLHHDISKADLVISHAGAGSCLEVLECKKPLLVVINEDLMDNHQLELAEQLQIDGHLYYCTCDTMADTLREVDFGLLTPFSKADSSMFVKYLDEVLSVQKKL